MSTPKFFRLERLCLKYVGLSVEESESNLYKAYSKIVLCVFIVPYPYLLLFDLINQGNFNEAVGTWFYALAVLMDGSVAIYIYFERHKLGNLIRRLESGIFAASSTRCAVDEEEKLLKNWFDYYRRQTTLFLSLSTITVTFPVIFTLGKRIVSSDYHDWMLAWGTVTMVNITYSPNFEFVWLYQNIAVIYIFSTAIPMILIMFGTLAFGSVQFKILHSYLKRLLIISREKDEGECKIENTIWERLNYHVQNAVRYHVRILNIVKEVQDIFHLPFLVMFSITLYLLCLQAYRASSLPTLDVRLADIVVEAVTAFFPVLMLCYYGEELAFTSQKVGNVAYQLDFVGTDIRFQKSLIMIIRRSQCANRIKAGGMIELSMETTVWIIHTGFSAYMMLRTINAP